MFRLGPKYAHGVCSRKSNSDGKEIGRDHCDSIEEEPWGEGGTGSIQARENNGLKIGRGYRDHAIGTLQGDQGRLSQTGRRGHQARGTTLWRKKGDAPCQTGKGRREGVKIILDR